MRYQSKIQIVEAVQHLGGERTREFWREGTEFRDGNLTLLAGKDGAQGWIPVPEGHWIVRMPGDLTDHWPVDPDYFAAKYEPVPESVPRHQDCTECGGYGDVLCLSCNGGGIGPDGGTFGDCRDCDDGRVECRSEIHDAATAAMIASSHD